MSGRQRGDTATHALEALCSHHLYDGFDCGEAIVNINLGDLLEKVNYGPEVWTLVLASPDHAVTGFLCLLEEDWEDETGEDGGRYFFLPYIGVRQNYQGTDAANRLARRMLEVIERRWKARNMFHRGVLAEAGMDPKLTRTLVALGFVPFSVDPNLLVMRLPRRTSN